MASLREGRSRGSVFGAVVATLSLYLKIKEAASLCSSSLGSSSSAFVFVV